MIEVVKSYSSTEEYIRAMQQSKIDELYEKAVDEAIDKDVTDEMIAEAFTKLADAEAEMLILEELYLQEKVPQKEVTSAKRRHTKAQKELDKLYQMKEEQK